MCNLNLPLVAWIDGELPESEATAVERHLLSCSDCRQSVSSYEGASRGFSIYYAAATRRNPATGSLHRVPRWVAVAAASAAAIVIALLLLPRAEKQSPATPEVAKVASPIELGTHPTPPTPAPRVQQAAKRRVAHHRQPLHEDWAIAQPAIQIAIPADSMFPPGAVPEGVAYIASVSFAADGSVQGFRLHP